MNLQGLVLNGYRAAPRELSATHPKFGLVREGLVERAGSGYEGKASDLRTYSPKRHDQLRSSSCVAQSTIRAAELKRVQKLFDEGVSKGMAIPEALAGARAGHVALSRLALYFLARELMDPQETDKDDGTFVSCAAEALKSFGVCREQQSAPEDRSFWPFDLGVNPATKRLRIFDSPPWIVMREAYLHKISAWYRLETAGDDRVRDVILALAAGNPVVYGTRVDGQWQTYDGTAPLGTMTGKDIGGHATVLEGWDPVRQLFLGENSWGEDWGVTGPDGTGGFYEMTPEKVASSESDDFVVIQGGWEEWRKAA